MESKEITVSPSSVTAYRELMTNPKEYGLDFKPLAELLEKTETALDKHLVYEQYLESIKRTESQIPKIFFYIIMDELYVQKKASSGNVGYCIKFI